jgi:hypothetical protein
MKAENLMNNNPLSTAKLKEFFLDKLVASFEEFDDDKDFKQFMIDSGITDQQIATVLTGNPRSCFDMFDKEDIVVSIVYVDKKGFTFYLDAELGTDKGYFDTRIDCELAALEMCVELLEEKLKEPEEEDNENK